MPDDEFRRCSGSVVLEATNGIVSTGLGDCRHFTIDGLSAGWHRLEVQLVQAPIVVRSLNL